MNTKRRHLIGYAATLLATLILTMAFAIAGDWTTLHRVSKAVAATGTVLTGGALLIAGWTLLREEGSRS